MLVFISQVWTRLKEIGDNENDYLAARLTAQIPKAWIPTIRKHQSQRYATNKRTSEVNVENENNNRIEISQSQQTTAIHNAVPNQSTPSPEED